MGYIIKSTGAYLLSALLMLGLCGFKLAQSIQTQPQDASAIDITDLETLTEKYFDSVFWAGITATSWNSPNELCPDCFIDFYIQNVLEKRPLKLWEDYSIPSSEFENYIRQFFDVDSLLLQKAEQYDKQKNEYANFGYLGGGASGKVTAAECQNDILILYYEYYSPAGNRTVIRTGTLTIRITGDQYQYLSCKTKAVDTNKKSYTSKGTRAFLNRKDYVIEELTKKQRVVLKQYAHKQKFNSENWDKKRSYKELLKTKLNPNDYLGFSYDYKSVGFNYECELCFIIIKVVNLDNVRAVINSYPSDTVKVLYEKIDYSLADLKAIEQEFKEQPFYIDNPSSIHTNITYSGIIEYK